MSLYEKMFHVSKIMRNSVYGKVVYDFLEMVGLRIFISRVQNWRTAKKNEKNADDQMIASREFFDKNQERVKCAMNLLADEESKDVYKKMIKFRCYSIYKELPHNSMRTQYFFNNFFEYKEEEVLVDCGAYDGDSIIAFKRRMKGKKYRIIAFEPDLKNYINLMRNHKDIFGINAGVWNEDGVLEFQSDGTSNSKVVFQGKFVENASNRVTVKSIDNIEECKAATFIKMDIEGSEYNALLGARKTIITNKPKLAICIYHSDEDMVRIIELLHDMVEDYKFYVRQHSNSICETVLYAQV